MQGKIVKGIAGFYYVNAAGTTYECKAKGIFRKDNRKPLVGDAEVGKYALYVKLRGAVGVRGGKREILFYRDALRLAVDRGR